MKFKKMYSGAVNSKDARLLHELSASETILEVDNGDILPEAPNELVLGGKYKYAETVLMIAKEGNILTVERAFQGDAKDWSANTTVARNLTEYDYNALVENVTELIDDASVQEHDSMELPDDKDILSIYGSKDALKKNKITWENIKTSLKTVFDNLYTPGKAKLTGYKKAEPDTETGIIDYEPKATDTVNEAFGKLSASHDTFANELKSTAPDKGSDLIGLYDPNLYFIGQTVGAALRELAPATVRNFHNTGTNIVGSVANRIYNQVSVVLRLDYNGLQGWEAGKLLGILPAGFRPVAQSICVAGYGYANNGDNIFLIRIMSNGEIIIPYATGPANSGNHLLTHFNFCTLNN